jgi:hypothetical protein
MRLTLRRHRRHRRRWIPLLLGVLLLCLFAPLAQSDARAPTAREGCPPARSASVGARLGTAPKGQTASAQVLVCVGSRAITAATYDHWARIARKSEGPAPKDPLTTGELLKEVMGFLISSDWVLGEAQSLGVHVSAGQARRTFDRVRRLQFPKDSEFEAFLEQSGQTVSDLIFRIRLNLLSERIQKRVATGHHSAASKQRALSRFVKGFKRKWRARTYCVTKYAVADCGHVRAAPL